ncbi:Ubiquitin carboxyl-terminal hydrolase isozyme L3 [Psilocybe cubensis]|uniref:Ubiquitin carboxyl-terminal hydrolase n=2 Tax=Psilocybe cubensis TaxID=181762 RepID=A0A8H8CGR7_PSICU|nr:Ubiquitin carboxyl-terminal hydrolase isozyme L3 [Psilocybe cubensis]KAH9475081.1 Ubiquitin carboxyl-terminal hydrolase isozyme L3 [Psilocybe cubensis]
MKTFTILGMCNTRFPDYEFNQKILENNPEAVNPLAYDLGLSKELAFHDVYSISDPELLSLIPRPALALLVIIPLTPTWKETREREDGAKGEYTGSGESEPVIWFKQTIHNACGSYGLIHCVLNSPEARKKIIPGSEFERILHKAIPLKMKERAAVLEESDVLEAAHEAAAKLGDTIPPADAEEAHRQGHHFVAFVKAKDGHLWELEGVRKGPLDRGALANDEDVLSEAALNKGLGRLMEIEREKGGDLRFSCLALAPSIA